MKQYRIKILLLFLLLSASPFVFSQQNQDENEPEKPLTRILFVFDGSQSMYGRWQSDLKINIARKILGEVLDTLKNMDNVEVALRVYGHQHQFPPQVCTDTRLEVPFGKDNHAKIKHRLRSITPKGTSPISYALSKTSQDFPACDNCRNIVVLITDGIEECGGDPCAVSRELQKNGVILKPFIIGIGRNFYEAFNCVGSYFDATSEEKFSQALHVVISRALNPTTAQVNLIDAYGKPTETNVNMTLYDNFSGLVKYNLIHTMNNKGLPDTLMIDPLLTYDMVVHTLPAVEVRNIQLTPGKHNIIAANVPQGELKIKTSTQNTLARNLVGLIRQKGRVTTINVQGFGQTERYLTGEYEIEVLSLPRLIIEDVNITQDHLTTVEIPAPGIAVIQKSSKGYGSLYVEKEGKLEWIYNFRESSSQQESLILLPGDYRAVFRSKYMNRSFYTVERHFTVKSGTTTNVRLDN